MAITEAALLWSGCASLAGFESDYQLGDISGADGSIATDGAGSNDHAAPSEASLEDGSLDGSGDDGPASFDAPISFDGSLDANCVTSVTGLPRIPLYMAIALDGSGSMVESNKWISASQALEAFFDDVQGRVDLGFGVGLLVFSDINDPCQGGTTPNCVYSMGSPNVPIAFVDSTQDTKLKYRITSSQPSSSTPTEQVMQGMYSYMENFSPTSPLLANGKKVVLLMTDGLPTDMLDSGLTPQQACIQMATTELAKTGPKGPIETFVVGVGELNNTGSYDPVFLGQLASAGGTAKPGCNPGETTDTSKMCHFQITPSAIGDGGAATLEQAFIGALDSIRAAATPCEFTIPPGTTFNTSAANVMLQDQVADAGATSIVPHDVNDGWTFDNPSAPSSVLLHGTSCTTVRAATSAKVSLVIGCPTQ